MDERTLIIFKPCAVRRKLFSQLFRCWEQAGFELVSMASSDDMPRGSVTPWHDFGRCMTKHYQEHDGKEFYPRLLDHMHSGLAIFAVFRGRGVIAWSRKKLTEIRRDLAPTETTANLVHASDSPESAQREIAIWFPMLAKK